jgi:hypothetical protein
MSRHGSASGNADGLLARQGRRGVRRFWWRRGTLTVNPMHLGERCKPGRVASAASGRVGESGPRQGTLTARWRGKEGVVVRCLGWRQRTLTVDPMYLGERYKPWRVVAPAASVRVGESGARQGTL